MKYPIYYLIADFVNFSQEALKTADILHYSTRYGNVWTGGNPSFTPAAPYAV